MSLFGFTPNPTPEALARQGWVRLARPIRGAGVDTDRITVVPGKSIIFYAPDGKPIDVRLYTTTAKRDTELAEFRTGLGKRDAARVLPC